MSYPGLLCWAVASISIGFTCWCLMYHKCTILWKIGLSQREFIAWTQEGGRFLLPEWTTAKGTGCDSQSDRTVTHTTCTQQLPAASGCGCTSAAATPGSGFLPGTHLLSAYPSGFLLNALPPESPFLELHFYRIQSIKKKKKPKNLFLSS